MLLDELFKFDEDDFLLLELFFMLDDEELLFTEFEMLLLEELELLLELDELLEAFVSYTNAAFVISDPLAEIFVSPLLSIVTVNVSLLIVYPLGAETSFTVYVPGFKSVTSTIPAPFDVAVSFTPLPETENVAPAKPIILSPSFVTF